MWPFKKRSPQYKATRKALSRKLRECNTRDGQNIVMAAMRPLLVATTGRL